MRNERNSLRQAAITAGILAALGVCTLGGDQPRVWAAEPSNNTAQAEAKTAAAQGVQAAADETENDGMSFDLEGVTVEAKRPDWEAKLSPGTVTVIRPDDYKGEQKDLPDLLKMVPGVHVRELNGKGQYTTVSVRGSTAAQFYSSIGFGKNLQQAFDQAKAALLLKGIAEEHTPVLYVRKGLLAQDIVMVESEALKKSDNVTIMQKIKNIFS